MHQQAVELRRLLLDEAVGRETMAGELVEIAARNPDTVLGAALRRQVLNQRIRVLELRGQASAIAERYRESDYLEG